MDCYFFFFQAEDGIRDIGVTGVQTCALPIFHHVGVEVVVGVDGVDVVAAHDVGDDAHRVVVHVRLARVHPDVAGVDADQVAAGAGQVGGGGTRRGGRRGAGAARVDPGVEPAPARARLGAAEAQRVV